MGCDIAGSPCRAAASLPLPSSRAGVFGWLRVNLFSSLLGAISWMLIATFTAWIVPPLLRFSPHRRNLESGDGREACISSPVRPIPARLLAFIRVWSSYFTVSYLVISAGGSICFFGAGFRRRLAVAAARVAPRHRRRLLLRRAADPVADLGGCR